jgi:hypothetical protein
MYRFYGEFTYNMLYLGNFWMGHQFCRAFHVVAHNPPLRSIAVFKWLNIARPFCVVT